MMVVSDSDNLPCGPGWEGKKRGQEKVGRPGEKAEMEASDDSIVGCGRGSNL